MTYLILVHVLCQLSLAQLIEGDNDQGHEDVDEEEGEDDEGLALLTSVLLGTGVGAKAGRLLSGCLVGIIGSFANSGV